MSKLREPVNGLTHCIGAVLSIAALVLLVVKASIAGKPWHIVSFAIFGSGLVLLYTFSTLYHWLNVSEKCVRFFRIMDHIMIFILIAATYTPICLIPLRGGWGWVLFGLIWAVAVWGILMSIFWIDAPRWVSTTLYITMGWLVIIGLWPLTQALQIEALLLLFLGGLFYTIGGIIYNYKKPNPHPKFGFHAVFHVLVMLGSLAHFWMFYFYISLL